MRQTIVPSLDLKWFLGFSLRKGWCCPSDGNYERKWGQDWNLLILRLGWDPRWWLETQFCSSPERLGAIILEVDGIDQKKRCRGRGSQFGLCGWISWLHEPLELYGRCWQSVIVPKECVWSTKKIKDYRYRWWAVERSQEWRLEGRLDGSVH